MSDAKPVARAGPRGRRENHHLERQAAACRTTHHSVHRRRRHGPRHLARERARVRRRRAKSLRRQAQDPLDGSVRRREGEQGLQHLAAGRDRHRLPRLPDFDQRTADHAGRRRYPLAQRRAAPIARSVRVPAAGALVQGRALAGQGAGEGRHGHFPREHRGHLRRHRIRGRHAPTPRNSSICSSRIFRSSSRRFAFPTPPASASSPPPRKAPTGCSAPPSSTPSPTSARA